MAHYLLLLLAVATPSYGSWDACSNPVDTKLCVTTPDPLATWRLRVQGVSQYRSILRVLQAANVTAVWVDPSSSNCTQMTLLECQDTSSGYERVRTIEADCPKGFFTTSDFPQRCVRVLPRRTLAAGETEDLFCGAAGATVDGHALCSLARHATDSTIAGECVLCTIQDPANTLELSHRSDSAPPPRGSTTLAFMGPANALQGGVLSAAGNCRVKGVYRTRAFLLQLQQYVSCPQESTTHDGRVYRWKQTDLGVTTIILCYSRTCAGDVNKGGFWQQPTKLDHCSQGSQMKRSAEYSSSPSSNAVDTVNAAQNGFSVIAASEGTDLQQVVDNLDPVLALEGGDIFLLRASVSNILQSFDAAVDNVKVENRVARAETPRVAVLVTDTRGVGNTQLAFGMILATSTTQDELLQTGSLKELVSEDSTDQLMNNRDLEAAIILPRSLQNNTRAGFAVFAENKTFQMSSPSNIKVNSRIVSLRLKSTMFSAAFPSQEQVDIIFKPKTNKFSTKTCVFWDFSGGGSWSSSGCELVSTSDNGLDLCRCNHATHFAEIITDADVDHDSVALDLITIIGCTLSLLGLLGIAITAVVFRDWRAQMGNKVLMNLAVAVSLNMAFFLTVASGVTSGDKVTCIAIGAALHYALLASFCWMLISAMLQFLRLVTVLGSRSPHLLLKSCIFGWGVPLIPIITLLSIDPYLYENRTSGFCYPQGLPFYLAVLAPIALVVFNNVIAYGAILYNIFPRCRNNRDATMIRHSVSMKNDTMRHLALSILLFFLFGLTWLFGFLARSIVFAYLFCASATLQGFVLFLFFIVGEKKVRKKWRNATSWSFSDKRRTGSTYVPHSTQKRLSQPHTTISADGRVETSFEF